MIKPEFKDALCIVNGGKFPIITHENSASSYKAVFSWHGNDIYIYIKTNRVKLCLSRWIFSRHAATSFSAYAPHSSAWRCSYWTHPWFSKLKVCIRSIGTTRITRSSPSVLFIWSIKECLTRLGMGLSVNLEILMPGRWHEAAGELGLLKMSSCRISPILVRMLKAKFNRAREYASRIEHPTSYNNKKSTKTIEKPWSAMTRFQSWYPDHGKHN